MLKSLKVRPLRALGLPAMAAAELYSLVLPVLLLVLLIELGLLTFLNFIAAKTAAVVDWFPAGLPFLELCFEDWDSKLFFAKGFMCIIQFRAANPVTDTFGFTVIMIKG